LGARICGVAKAGEALINRTTCDLIRDTVDATPVTDLKLKGVSGDVVVYRVNQLLE